METGLTSENLLDVDAIVHPRWLLSMTASQQVLEHHSLVIDKDLIVEIAPTADIKNRYRSQREITLDSHVLMPGLINAHGHAPMSLLRGFADDLPLHPWLEQKIWPTEARWLSETYVADGARLAIAEMLLGGTTCFTDMYFFADQIAAVVSETGIRAQLSSPVFDFPTLWASTADEYVAKATRLNDQYRNSPLVSVAFGPHAPYTVSDAPLSKVGTLAEELDVYIHMHVHENSQEVQDAIRDKGLRPLSRLKHLGLLSPRLQCIHMTQLLDEEISLLAEHGVSVVHCPASNLKLASGFCRVGDLLAAGVNVALGTDSCASNNNLDMFSEMRLASLLAKGTTGDASIVPAFQALQMATVNGARAMGMDERLGTLEAGKLADMIAVDLDHARTQPVYNVISTLVYSAHSSQVSHVWVNGEMLVEEGKLVRINQAELLATTREWGRKIAEGAQS